VTKGKARVFANELVEWASASGFTSLVVIAGADDMLRHDPNMLRYESDIPSSSMTLSDSLSCIKASTQHHRDR
jgi:hypothetical protein